MEQLERGKNAGKGKGSHPPAIRAGSNRLFQVRDLYWRSPKSGYFWCNSRQLKKTICSRSRWWSSLSERRMRAKAKATQLRRLPLVPMERGKGDRR